MLKEPQIVSYLYFSSQLRAAVSVFKNPEEKLYEVENPKFERLTLLRFERHNYFYSLA